MTKSIVNIDDYAIRYESDGITGKKAGHHRENAVVLVFAGILTDYDG